MPSCDTGGRARLWAALAVPTVVLAAGLANVAAPASAAYLPGAVPASALGADLGDGLSTEPLISADGRHVVFTTRAETLLGRPGLDTERYSAGVVRKDTVTGDIELVAPPQRVLRASPSTTVGTGTPGGIAGISADGRYVLFSTTARLSPDDPSGITPDVYVRDMTQPVGASTAYELVSARDGETTGAEYDDPAVGSIAGAAGFALSGDGRRAVFVTLGASNLPARSTTSTPRWQVWLRDLDSHTTRLVSRDVGDASLEGVPAQPPVAGVQASVAPTAAISADGGAVAWSAGEAQRQTPTLAGEGSLGAYPALLWRRVDTPTAPARRVAGSADLDDPACDPATTYVPGPGPDGPCYGPFITSEGANQQAPGTGFVELGGISADGTRVLFTSSAGRRPFDVAAYRPATAFLADMRPGVPRKLGVTVAWSYPANSDVRSIRGGRLAADGRHAVFASRDNRFDGLQGIGGFPGGELITSNAYAIDLDARTVERVTTGFDGRDYTLGSGQLRNLDPLAVNADASAVAFSSDDGNLFVGDANGFPDVLVARTAPPAVDRPGRDLPPPPATPVDAVPAVKPLPSRYLATLGPVEVSPRTGTATVRVSLPAAGRIVGTAVGTSSYRVRRNGKLRTVRTKVTVGRQSRTSKSAKAMTIRITVGAAARKALNRAPRTLSVRLALRYTPKGARATTTTRTYRLKQSHVAGADKARRPSRGTR